MAVKPYGSMSSGQILLWECFLEYNDTDARVINDNGDPDDYRVVRWFGTNHHTKPLIVSLMKANGRRWRQVTVPPGNDFSIAAGGQLRYEFDVPQWFWEWGD